MNIQNQLPDQPENLTGGLLQCLTDPRCRILMVDNDPYRCELNAEMLRRHSYVVKATRDGETGWEELQTNRYHLLITNSDLPGLSGVGLVKKAALRLHAVARHPGHRNSARLGIAGIPVASEGHQAAQALYHRRAAWCGEKNSAGDYPHPLWIFAAAQANPTASKSFTSLMILPHSFSPG